MKIKKAEKENINQLSILFLDSYKYYNKIDKRCKIKPDDISLKYIKKDLKRFFNKPGNNSFLIAEENNKIVGFIKFGIAKVPFIIHEKEAWIYTIYVDKKYRRQGLAVKLIKEAAKRLKKKGFKEIEISYIQENKEGVGLWKSLKAKTIYINARGIIDIKNVLKISNKNNL